MVIHQISRSHRLKNRWFGSNLSKITRPVAAIKSLRFALLKVIRQISRSHGLKNWWFESNLSKITRPVAAIKSLRFALLSMFPSSYHHEIFRIYYQWHKWCWCKRSRSEVKVTEVMTPFSLFRTVTPVWIHILQWNDAYSLMLLRRGALLFFKIICQISRSHGSKNHRIWPRLGVSGL